MDAWRLEQTNTDYDSVQRQINETNKATDRLLKIEKNRSQDRNQN